MNAEEANTKSIWDCEFIVTDVETTGHDAVQNRLTEIACVSICGGKIINEYSSLINPHQIIPAFIAKMTGISQVMAANAPEAIDVLPQVSSLLSNESAVFVAHNVSFDWSFLKESFERNYIEYPEIPQLCSLKLARRLLPGNLRKGVGGLSEHFKVKIKSRHRALDDARATAKILIELLELANREHDIETVEQLLAFQNKKIQTFRQQKTLYKKFESKLEQLPAEPGVYYFFNKNDKVIYVGKAKVLKERVKSYFTGSTYPSSKVARLVRQIEKIDWVLTGSELAALIFESREIKRLKPQFNSLELKYRKLPFIKFTSGTQFPRIEVASSIDNDCAEYFGPFRSSYLAGEIVRLIEKSFPIRKCDDMTFKKAKEPCFYYHLHNCDAPCMNYTSLEEYNRHIENIRHFLSGYDGGIINLFESKMNEHAENLEFEEAAFLRNRLFELKRALDRQEDVPTSMETNNQIIIIPASNKDKTVDIFMIKSGRLVHHEIIGRKSPLAKINNLINNYYYNGFESPLFYTIEDIDELRIISSWISRIHNASFIYINNKDKDSIILEVQQKIRNTQFE